MLTGALTTQLPDEKENVCDWGPGIAAQKGWITRGEVLEEIHCAPFHSLSAETPSYVNDAVRRHEIGSGARGSNLILERGICLTDKVQVGGGLVSYVGL